jgi:hypothetical protein
MSTSGFTVPHRVTQGLAQMPGHDPVGRQLPSGDLLVVLHHCGQQFQAGTQPRARVGAQLVLRFGGSDGCEVHHQPEFVVVPHLVVAVQVAVHEHGRTRRGEHGVGPVAPAQDGPALIRPDPRPEPVAQGLCRGGRQHRAGERADGGLGALADGRWCRAARNRTSCLAARSGSIEPTTSNREAPGTRLVIRSKGSVLAVMTSGRNGTAGWRASAARTPISCASWSAAGRDQANFTKNRSPTGTLPECHCGSCLPAGPGTVTGYPLRSGATTRSAS